MMVIVLRFRAGNSQGKEVSNSMDSTSILTKPVIDAWLRVAKRNLKKDGYLVSVLFAKLTNDRIATVNLGELTRAKDHQQKQLVMSMIGKKLRSEVGDFTEAVMIVEGWYVGGQEPGALSIAPSQHPARQEAICIMARNASNTRTTSVIQPFTRDADNQPVWGKIPLAVYNASPGTSPAPMGLLDYLFTLTGETH
jgi:hypothetical protein